MQEVDSNLGASETLLSTITYNRPVSALEDPAHYNIRHPLQSKWTLWYRASTKPNSVAAKNAAKSDNWEASLQCVNTVDTIEDFWGMYNNVPGIDKMEDNSDYMFFKEGVRPAWEDPANANGGSFTIQFKGSVPGIGEFAWLNTVRTLIFLFLFFIYTLLAHDGYR
jgi:translation initiation factor 4E